MDQLPEFMRHPANKIARSAQATPGIEGFVFHGAEGSQMAFWTCAVRTVALLIIVMAMSAGIFAFVSARDLPRQLAEKWLINLAGLISLAFALGFLGFVFGWIKLDPASPGQTLLWLGSYFGFSALCMLGLGLRPPCQILRRGAR